ncbi:hypothetical protein Dsin_006791 [Dipteronia sinensis]|uniref:F-box protein n=1 Tax=Dipteronia sinensis TaxID=43782 RepID=A0AAE0EG78_9ROSI|nr:hypothetical protein Dsin_006791 [Dipteronia sinensis]
MSSSTVITCSISAVHSDIIETHILTRLDGPTLASTACVSSQLYSLITCDETLWTNICHSTWPSTNTPRLSHVISTFEKGPRSFFSDSFTNPDPTATATAAVATESASNHDSPSYLISAVDIYYRNKLMLSKIVETETVSGWYQCSPFRVDLLDPKDTVATRIPYPDTEEACQELAEDFTLSWILIDPTRRRAMNLSSNKPVSVQRHWLSGEVQVRFASMLSGGEQCGIVITCGRSQMHVREVSLQVEDTDGMHLSGKDSLVILQRALEGKRENNRRREEEGKRRYEHYLEMRRVRRERKLRTEWTLDMLFVAFGVFIFTSLGLFAFWR